MKLSFAGISGFVVVGVAMAGGCAEQADDATSSPTEEVQEVIDQHAAALTSTLGTSAQASFVFPVPEGCGSEQDPLPPPWDPTFPFMGSEELRFLPGFGDGTSPQNFSYDYLLWIDSGPAVTSSSLSAALLEYYKGLICGVPGYPCEWSDFQIRLRSQLKTRPLEVMTGSIDMLDMAHLPISLNFFVSSVVCPASHHRAVLVSASPQSFTSPVFAGLLQLQLRFRCQ